jgi:hypothetical protein
VAVVTPPLVERARLAFVKLQALLPGGRTTVSGMTVQVRFSVFPEIVPEA